MSTLNETSTQLTPPGIQITGDTNVINWKKVNGNGITFPRERPTTPLPPLVQTTFYPTGDGSTKGTLEVCAFVFIAANLDENSPIKVYFEDINPTPNFYITYDAPEIKSAQFAAYEVTFAVGFETKPKNINSIVWNEDPETSRGTLTDRKSVV